MAYDRPQKTEEEIEAERKINQKMLEEANENARRTLRELEDSEAERMAVLRGKTVQNMPLSDEANE